MRRSTARAAGAATPSSLALARVGPCMRGTSFFRTSSSSFSTHAAFAADAAAAAAARRRRLASWAGAALAAASLAAFAVAHAPVAAADSAKQRSATEEATISLEAPPPVASTSNDGSGDDEAEPTGWFRYCLLDEP
jgi:hypothetical protein